MTDTAEPSPQGPHAEQGILVTHEDGTHALIPESALRAFSLTPPAADRATGMADPDPGGWSVAGSLGVTWFRPWEAHPEYSSEPPQPPACVGQGRLVAPEGLDFVDHYTVSEPLEDDAG